MAAPQLPSEVVQLQDQNRTLVEQVKRLVVAERRLYQTKRDLSRQLRQMKAVSGLALGSSGKSPPQILELGAKTLFSLSTLDQALGFLTDAKGQLSPVLATAAPGRESKLPDPLGELCRRPALLAAGLRAPVLVPLSEVPAQVDGIARCFDEAFGGASGKGLLLVLPLSRENELPLGALALRHIGGPVSLHDELPSERDLPFLALISQQVCGAVYEAQLAARERLAALGELSAVMAHELRNPLAVIFNSLEALKLTPVSNAPRLLEIVKEEAQRLDAIVVDLLSFALPTPSDLRPEALHPILLEALRAAEAASQGLRKVVLEEPCAPILVPANVRMLRQVFVNLIVNALQAAPQGKVEVRLSQHSRGQVPLARVEVRDTGQGIAPENLRRVFEPFFTTKASGTGLGLALVERFVEAHRGRVEVHSQLGVGTTFSVLLPLALLLER